MIDTSKASILTRVKIKNKKTGHIVEYLLVSEEEADLKAGKISMKSPIGNALLGKEVGDTVLVDVPAGKIEFEIIKKILADTVKLNENPC